MANEFDDVLDQESTGTLPPLSSGLEKGEFDDVLDTEVSQQQSYVRNVIDIASKDNPEAAAERVRLSQSTGLPPDVVARNQQELKRREIARAIDLQRMMRDSPVLFRQMTDPTFTAAAIDDLDTLRQIEKSFTNIADYATSGEMASDAGGAARSLALGATVGVGKMVFDIFGAATDLVGLDYLSGGYRTMSDNARQAMDAYGLQADTSTGRAVKSGLESAGQNLALLPLGLERRLFQTAEAAGAAVAGAMSVGVGADSYQRARGEGVGRFNSALYGINDAGVEFLMEKIPAGQLFKGIELDNSLLKLFAQQTVTEGWTEQVTTLAQDFNEWMALHPEKSTAQFLAERPEAAYQTFIATLIGTGVQTTAIAGINKLVEKASNQALVYEQDRLKRQLQLAGMSALRARSPEQFRANMEQVVANAPEGAPTEIHVDAEVLNQLTPEMQALLPESVRAQIPEALAMNATVPISMADVLTTTPRTELEQILNDNARIGSPDAPSRVEAEKAAEFIQQDAERVLQQAQDQSAWQSEVDTVQQTIKDQLDQAGRFTSDVNEGYARLQSQFFSVMASRFGITPSEMYQRFSVKVAGQMGQGEVLNAGSDQTQTPEFKNWFGDSKVVDTEGRPLVVYHGAPDTRFVQEDGIFKSLRERLGMRENDPDRAFFFAADQRVAASYADDRRAFDYQAAEPGIISTYLSLKNPLVIDNGGQSWKGTRNVVETAKQGGHDGVIIRNVVDDYQTTNRSKPTDVYVAFNPTQIKSATGNQGTFDPNDPNILRQSARERSGAETQTEAFKRWSNDAPLIRYEDATNHKFQTGEKVAVEGFHGTKRPDRVGTKFLKKRATSGPMAFFTSAPDLASSYASGKADTSLSYEEQSYASWFKVKVPGARNPVDVVRAWYSLPQDVKNTIASRMPDIRTDDDGNVIYEEGGGDIGAYEWNLKQTQRGWNKQGNPLEAAVETWLTSGALFNAEEKFLKVLELSGMPMRDVTYDSPLAEYPFVYKVYIAFNKPLVTSDVPQDVKDALNAAAKKDRSRAKLGGADMWDKNTRTLREWVDEFNKPNSTYVWTSIPDKVTEVFRSLGYDGVIDQSGKGGGDQHPVYIPFDETQVKSAIGNKGTYSREKNDILKQQTRGTFNPQTLLISLGPQSDLSTFLHESSHFFLEVMADLAAQPDAPAQVREDMDKVLGWFGVPDLATWNTYTLDQKRPHHERWAESFEQYLLEGKAPSAELQPLFRRFRAWLVNVYKSLTDFMRGRNLELNDEIRQVFDRMLATDEQIAQAEEQAGLLPDFDATNAAIERLQERSLRNLKWTLNARSKFLKQFTKEAKELRKGILTEVLAEFEQRPDAMASRAIRKVRNKDGAERDAKIAAIADATGYPTVEEMTAAVTALGPVNEAVEAEVDRRMLERHGDMATQEALEAAANEAVHNEARARALAAELKAQDEALNPRETTGETRQIQVRVGSKKEGTQRVETRTVSVTVNALVEAARAFGADLAARRQVGKLKNAIYLHRAAEARAGKAWQTATKKGDSKAAVQAKKDQLLNNQAVRALLDAQAEVRSAIEFFRKVTKGNNEKLVKGGRDPDVVNAMRAILGVYGIAPRTGKGALEYMELVQTNDPETAKALMPAVINAVSRNKPYTELTVEELRGLTDDLKSMWRLAKESRQIEVDGVRMSIEDAREKLYGRLEEKGIPDKVPGQTSARTAEDKAAENLRELRGNLTRVEQWSEAMDGSIGGPFNTILFRAIKVAADNYRAARAPVFKRLEEATQAVKPFIARTPINAPRLNYVFGLGDGHNNTGMAELLAALLNTGNESNKRKLLLGGRPGNPWATENPDGTLNTSNWDATIADLVADGTLRKEHFDYVQAVWDVLESLKPLAQESHRRVFGRYFSEVTAQPFVDPFGVARSGGYYPAKVDPALVPDGQLRELARQENESLEFSFPAAPSGWSKSRVENYTKPLLLDTNLVYRHIDEVLLFSHMQPSVNAVNRLLRDRKLVSALSRVSPEAYGSILTPWLAGAARQIVEEQVPSDGGFNRAASIIRSRTGLQLMMANASNTLQQITGAFTAASKLEADGMERSALIKAAAKWASNPKALRDNVWSLSSYMRDRSENETAVLLDTMRDIMFNPTLMESAQKWSRQHGYFTQVFFDNTLSPIVWSAGYSAYLNKLPKVDTSGMSATEVQALLARQNREAVLYADALVRQTQGSNLPEDVSRFERGTGFVRLFNQFAGYFNMQANTNAASIVKLAEQGGLKKNAARGFYVLMMGLLMPIWVAEAIAIAFRGGPDDDDDDGAVWDDWLKAIFGLGTFKGLVAMVPVAGQIASAAVNRVATGSPADDRVSVSPVLSVLESAVGGNVYTGYQLATGKEVNAQRAVKDMALLIGLATGVPAYAVARPLGYAAGVAQGKIEPTGPADFARGMVTGTASPESKTP